ncbi:MAG: hypothetical protein A2138_24685 [Deltaproteobacteria bacterium RBG_16_71_12]|nr:MAG: hypothetical protein A2138_24685 [Deltaproteobacteria bacterium RBG_16_71_12]
MSKVGAADPAAVLQSFSSHLIAQLESRPVKDDGERAAAIAVAKARTESTIGVVLSAEDVKALVAASTAIGVTVRQDFGTKVSDADFAACTALLVSRGLDATLAIANTKAGLSALRGVVTHQGAVKAKLDELAAVPVDDALRARLWRVLEAEPFDARATVLFVMRELGGADVMREWMGTKESTSLATHTEQVIARYLKERRFHDVTVPPGVRLEPMLRWMLTLHDIGKPAAVEHGDRALQHAFTTPVLVELSKKLGFSEREVGLMRAVVDNDAIGETLHWNINRDLDDAARELRALAREAGMAPGEFFELQSLFFVSDAGSYRFLLERIFTTDERGALALKNEKFEQLRARVVAE